MPSSKILLIALALLLVSTGVRAQAQNDQTAPALPEDLRGAKIYHVPDEKESSRSMENPCIFREVTYRDIDLDRLALNVRVALKAVDRAATIRRMYFQDVRVNGLPVRVETFDKELKLSKDREVDLPAPLVVSLFFTDLDSLEPLRDLVKQDQVKVTGLGFFELKLSFLTKLVLRSSGALAAAKEQVSKLKSDHGSDSTARSSQQVVVPVKLDQDVPLHMFPKDSLAQMAAGKLLDTLADPHSLAALAVAKERVSKLSIDRALDSTGRSSLYVLDCEYVLRNPQTQQSQKFSQSGTGFLVSADGKLLTAKRVIQPWKFDPEVAFLMNEYHLELDPKGYRIAAWPVGAQVLTKDGELDFKSALTTENGALQVTKIAADKTEPRDYQDPDSGEKATLTLDSSGPDDTALLKLTGSGFRPLVPMDAGGRSGQSFLFGFPFALSQKQASPRRVAVHTTPQAALIGIDHALNPGESGAPLIGDDGKVLALCAASDECIPIDAALKLLQ